MKWQQHVEEYETQQQKNIGNKFDDLMWYTKKFINPDTVKAKMKDYETFREPVRGHEEEFITIEYVL